MRTLVEKHRGLWALVVSVLIVTGCTPAPTPTPDVPTTTQTVTETESSTTTTPPNDDLTNKTVSKAQGAFPQAPRNSSGQVDVIQFLDTIVQHADQQIWVPYFANLGLKEPMVDVVYVGSEKYPTYLSNCDLNENGRKGDDVVEPDTPNAWYCPSDGGQWDGALILPVTTFANMWIGPVLKNVSLRPGDAAAAAVLAHEFGHHVAAELEKQLSISQDWGTHNPELFADCAAGIWMAGAGAHGYLESGDLEEAVSAMIAVGVNGSKTHGTAQQRYQAFMAGYQANHLPYVCMQSYWPAMAYRMQTR